MTLWHARDTAVWILVMMVMMVVVMAIVTVAMALHWWVHL